MNILVIIVTYNGMQWLERCLSSLVNSTISVDAYIVDNGSTDGSQQFITDNYSQFTFYQSPINSGFGAANNIGLKYAIEHNYDYVYLLNQDAWVMPNTIETLVKTNIQNPEYGVLSPLQTNAEISTLDKNFALLLSINQYILSDYILNNPTSLYEVNFIMAAHWLISRECLLDVGFFSPVFFHYGEDGNYLHRVQYFKYKIGVVPNVVGVHDREFRKLTKKTDVFMLLPQYLVCASNINKSFLFSITKAIYVLLKNTVLKAIKYRDIRIVLSLFSKLFYVRKIYIDRKTNKLKRVQEIITS